jgi:hypothetical protein
MLFDKFNDVFEVRDAGGFSAVVSRGYKVIDGNFVLVEEWMDVLLIEDFCALCLWQDKVEEEAKADPRIERNPNPQNR